MTAGGAGSARTIRTPHPLPNERERLRDPVAAPDEIPHTSKRIEEAALQLFYERGFKTTTTREIALACGLTPGALYNHFGSKDEILSTLILGIHREMQALLDEAVTHDGRDPETQLKAFCRAHGLLHTTYITQARVANRELGSLKQEALEEVIAIRRRASEQLRDIIQRGCDAGVFEVVNIPAVSNLILTMGMSIADWFRPDGQLDREEMADLHAATALRMVKDTHEGGGK